MPQRGNPQLQKKMEVSHMLKLGLQFFAHKKGVGSTKNGRDSRAQRLGVKKSDGQTVLAGNIIVRQRGTNVHPARTSASGLRRYVVCACGRRCEVRALRREQEARERRRRSRIRIFCKKKGLLDKKSFFVAFSFGRCYNRGKIQNIGKREMRQ